MKYFTTLILVVLTSLGAFAQTNTLSYEGRVVDQDTGQPIPNLIIYLKNGSINNVTNRGGEFRIRVSTSSKSDTLVFSHLGYSILEVPIPIFDNWEGSFKMAPTHLNLEEVEVTAKRITADDIMDKVANSRKKNFTSDFFKMEGYYKHQLKMDNKEIGFVEVALDLVDDDFQTYKYKNGIAQETVILNGIKKNINKYNEYKSTLGTLESTDYLNNMLIINRPRRGFKGFQYRLDTTLFYRGDLTYLVEATLEGGEPEDSFWKFKIFVNADDFAIVRMESVMRTAEYNIEAFDKRVNDTLVNRPQVLSRILEFRKMSGFYYPIYYRMTGKEKLDNLKDSTSRSYEFDNELLLFNLSQDDSRYEKNRRIKTNVIDDKFDKLKFDSAFWTNYNYKRLSPTEEIKEFLVDGNEEVRSEYHVKDGYRFTKLDTLQGTLTPLRTSYDVGFYHLDVEVLPKEEILKGSSLIQFRVVNPTNRIQIDLYSGMKIEKIELNGRQLNFEREYNAVYVNFPQMLDKSSIYEIKVFYSGPPVDFNLNIPMYASFLWLEDDSGNPWLQAICQGYGASGWWPNKDHLSDEPDSARISVTIPQELDVVSNGRLLSTSLVRENKKRFDWRVSYPINNYNLTFNVGNYKVTKDIYDNGTTKLDLEYHILEENDTDVSITTAIVKPMLQTFEKYFGPYPFPKDGFKLVESPHPMEHQSCVAIGSDYFYDSDDSGIWSDMPEDDINYSIVLHESAHEWWGNSVSCTDNAELWIHEAFATYAEALFVEDHYGYEASQRYINAMKHQVLNRFPIQGKPGVNHIHYDITDMYTKGAIMINELRKEIDNDQMWFSVLKGIQQDFKHSSITTVEVIDYINIKTGRNFDCFFQRWLLSTEPMFTE
ncbi:MAG: M1 family aminopeptidase [Bacteroidota bacterium]